MFSCLRKIKFNIKSNFGGRYITTYDDSFSGCFINLDSNDKIKYINSESLFIEDVKNCIEEQILNNKNALWLKIPQSMSFLINPSIEKLGFNFHHANSNVQEFSNNYNDTLEIDSNDSSKNNVLSPKQCWDVEKSTIGISYTSVNFCILSTHPY